MLTSVCAVCLGACAGALARWGMGAGLNPLVAGLPLGTLAVNWLGSLIMGILLAFFAVHAPAQPWRLLLVTGFLGSFTTFSAFAGEMAQLILAGRHMLFAWGIFLHVAGSIALVLLGMALFHAARALAGQG